jgi:hypothetical protein
MNCFHYAEAIKHLYIASEELDMAAGALLISTKTSELFKEINDKRMELRDLIKRVMERGAKEG